MVNFAKLFDEKINKSLLIIFPKLLATFTKTFSQFLPNLWQIIQQKFNSTTDQQYNSANVGRMIYFRENSIITFTGAPSNFWLSKTERD